eukprot:139255-Chlamydomonas_euryale.AAC.1
MLSARITIAVPPRPFPPSPAGATSHRSSQPPPVVQIAARALARPTPACAGGSPAPARCRVADAQTK